MSIENNEERNISLPDLPPNHPANLGLIGGMQNIVSLPPPAWGEPQTSKAAVAVARASKARKPRVAKTRYQTEDAADRTQQPDAVAKLPRKTRATAKVTDAGEKVKPEGSEAATRSRRKTATKATVAQEQDRRASFKSMFGPPRADGVQVSSVSYRPKMAHMMPYQPTAVQFGQMEIGLNKTRVQEQEASVALVAADIKRANRVIGTSLAMLSAPIGAVTREQAADLIAGDFEDVRAIKDERARQLALNAMIESGQAQPHYKDALERLAPDLLAPAEEASISREADRAVRDAASQSAPDEGKQKAENTIEPGIAPELDTQLAKDSHSTPSVEPAALGVAEAAHAPGLGGRMLRAISEWVRGKGKEKAQARAPSAKPMSLDKQAAPAAAADDKAHLVPDAVAQRFLKIERDYYFPDQTLAFSDRGNKLATRGAHPEVVRSLIEIAQTRGWDSITVKGTDEFRRSAWMEAMQAGLKVAGYKPTALDLAEVASKPVANTVEKGIPKEREAAATQKVRTQPFKAGPAAQAPRAAEPAPNPELAAKARAFEKEKPGFVMKKFPELAQAYGVVDAARKFADANLSQDVRDEFVSLARRHVMQKILAGEQVRGPKIYAAAAKTRETVEPTQAPAQPAVDLGKAARSKQVARER